MVSESSSYFRLIMGDTFRKRENAESHIYNVYGIRNQSMESRDFDKYNLQSPYLLNVCVCSVYSCLCGPSFKPDGYIWYELNMCIIYEGGVMLWHWLFYGYFGWKTCNLHPNCCSQCAMVYWSPNMYQAL